MEHVAAEAARYIIGLSISYKNVKVYGDKKEETHIRLTIKLPSDQFATQLHNHLSHIRDGKNNYTFSGETVKLQDRKVSIILPSGVVQVEIDSKGITLLRPSSPDKAKKDNAEDADAWQQYCRVWSQKTATETTKLVIPYDWTHKKLAEVVGYPSE